MRFAAGRLCLPTKRTLVSIKTLGDVVLLHNANECLHHVINDQTSGQNQLKYGKNYYDFDEGTMSFIAPNQVISIDNEDNRNKDGWSLLFHPDLIRE